LYLYLKQFDSATSAHDDATRATQAAIRERDQLANDLAQAQELQRQAEAKAADARGREQAAAAAATTLAEEAKAAAKLAKEEVDALRSGAASSETQLASLVNQLQVDLVVRMIRVEKLEVYRDMEVEFSDRSIACSDRLVTFRTYICGNVFSSCLLLFCFE
jgi:hypothetical protein